MLDRIECKTKAKELLRGRWGNAAGMSLFIGVISIIASSVLAIIPILGIILVGAVSAFLSGSALNYCIKLNETDERIRYMECFITLGQALKIFIFEFLMGVILIGVVIVTLPITLLLESALAIAVLILPIFMMVLSIIIEAGFFAVPMFIVENPDMGIMESVSNSWNLTKGFKFDYFIMSLSFIGWVLLAGLTFGIGSLWLQPYMTLTFYIFYKGLLNKDTIKV
ncbi:DUF975 family protein [Clostridium sp. B9]|uniref:DUF975 family protein n=1 Tax=Clostridium sp. B9 TaxID=3423224 RepID=UPI003D2EF4EE